VLAEPLLPVIAEFLEGTKGMMRGDWGEEEDEEYA